MRTLDDQRRYPVRSKRTSWDPAETLDSTSGVVPDSRPSTNTRAPVGRDSTESDPGSVFAAGRLAAEVEDEVAFGVVAALVVFFAAGAGRATGPGVPFAAGCGGAGR